MRKRVIFLTAILTHYRVEFHDLVRRKLASEGVDYVLMYGQPSQREAAKHDTAELDWGEKVNNTYFQIGGRLLTWQPLSLKNLRSTDLLILGQENKLLVNYILQMTPSFLRPRLAFWGHGRNLQGRPSGLAERWKRFWVGRVDWWFCYTERTRDYITGLGFPVQRTTVFNNSVDTARLSELAEELPPPMEIRRSLGIHGHFVGIFVGGLYADKRLEFLIASADLVRREVPTFELLVVGDGEDRPFIEAAAATRPWLHVYGAKFGLEKAALMKASDLFLMPGLLGLAVLDAYAIGLPVITTNFPRHSPEIAYLEHGRQGLIVAPYDDTSIYAEQISKLLQDPSRLSELKRAARASSKLYSAEKMANLFVDGVIKALRRTDRAI